MSLGESSKGDGKASSVIDLGAALPTLVGALDKDIRIPTPGIYNRKRSDLKQFIL